MSTMNASSETKIFVLKTSARGARLISDGIKAVWVMGRQVREDGTLTRGAVKALSESTTTFNEALANIAIKDVPEGYEELAAEARKENANKMVKVRFNRGACVDYSEKAIKVQTNKSNYMYGRTYFESAYLPKSKVTMTVNEDGTVDLVLPFWLYKKNDLACWLMV